MSNYYLTFDGTTGYITVNNNAVLNLGTDSFSMGGVLYVPSVTESYVILKKGLVFGYELSLVNGVFQLDLTGAAGSGSNVSSPTVGANQITFWFMTVDSSTENVMFYVNGNDVSDGWASRVGAWPDTNTSNSLTIGQGGNVFFKGWMDDLRLYTGVAITQAQVRTIFAGGFGKKYDLSDAGSGLVFEFDDNSNPNQTVSSGSAALTGIFTGGVTYQSGGVPFGSPFNSGSGGGIMAWDEELW